MKFLSQMLASTVGVLLALSVFVLIGFGVIGALVAAGEKEVVVKDNSVLKLNFGKPIKEISEENPFDELDLPASPLGGAPASALGINDIRKALRNAKEDDRIKGLYMNVSGVASGYANLAEVHDLIQEFKESDKFFYAYATSYSEGAYMLASLADSVFLHPMGGLEFNGIGTQKMYYKGMFDKFGVEPMIFKVGDFKSAVEPYFRKEMSEADRKQLLALFGDLQADMYERIGQSVGKSAQELYDIASQSPLFEAEDALKYGLVSRTAHEDEVLDLLRQASGANDSDEEEKEEEDGKKKKKKIDFISFGKYVEAIDTKAVVKEKKSDNEIAVVVCEGVIVDGQGGDGEMGGDKIAKILRQVREDEDVKAVVLRVNSPGGSALASEVMEREVRLIAQEKPIIASMSDVAASGGYWLSMGCDKIVARRNTITGSIGVFGVMMNLKNLMNEEVGITFDKAQTNPYAVSMNPFQEMSEGERAYWQNSVEQTYEEFVTKVAEGRNLPVDSVKAIGSGRVWSGEDAFERGLVDKVGDFEDAVALAAEAAELGEDYELKYFPKKKDFWQEFAKNFGNAQIQQTQEQKLREELGPLYPLYQEWKAAQKLQGVQALMPYHITVE